MKFWYSFPAIKGVQANREYYITMVPISLLAKIFPPEDDIVLPEYRAQRKINEARIPEIKKYILENRNNYVFSALSASIDGDFEFNAFNNTNMGVLQIDMDAIFLINDGQHRKAAIEAALREDETLLGESISIVMFKDEGLKRSQQMFTDLNKHAVKTSNSLATLYDTRDILAVATKEVIENVAFFQSYTDKERDILGKNSSKLITLNTIYKANQRIVRYCKETDIAFLIEYWTLLSQNIYEWNQLSNKELTKKDLRENYIVTLSITLNAFGRLGCYFYSHRNQMSAFLPKLKNIDWSRNSDNWKNRIIRENGKVMNNEEAITLTCIKIKELIGIPLTTEERNKEQQIKDRK